MTSARAWSFPAPTLHLRRPDLFQAPVVLLAPWPDRGASSPAPRLPGATIDPDAAGPLVTTRAPSVDLSSAACARMVLEARMRIQQNRYQTYVRRWLELRAQETGGASSAKGRQ